MILQKHPKVGPFEAKNIDITLTWNLGCTRKSLNELER